LPVRVTAVEDSYLRAIPTATAQPSKAFPA
jgi:hypothetical protein